MFNTVQFYHVTYLTMAASSDNPNSQVEYDSFTEYDQESYTPEIGWESDYLADSNSSEVGPISDSELLPPAATPKAEPSPSSEGRSQISGRKEKNENSKNKLLGKLPYKLSTDAFYSTTTEQERDLIRFEVNCALQHFLEFDRPVFLEGLGLILPLRSERARAYPSDNSLVVRKELVRSVTFEKCDDITGTQSVFESEGKKIVETYELANRIYPRLPLAMHLKWSMQAMRSLLRAYVISVRERLVTKGVSQSLSAIGTLYAMHNRQGQAVADWFAGSDILLQPRRSQVLQVLESKLCSRPVFETAWEPLEALHGKPITRLCLDLLQILNDTGFAVDDYNNSDTNRQVEVAVFLDKESKPQQPKLIWCTDGIRQLAKRQSQEIVATELIIQTPAHAQKPATSVEKYSVLASRLMALGWAILHSTKNKTLRPGLGINTESPLISNPKSLLTAAVATHMSRLSGIHLCKEGEFSYANITGISHKEAKLISAGKRINLLAMLELRGLDQITQPGRPCLLENTKLD